MSPRGKSLFVNDLEVSHSKNIFELDLEEVNCCEIEPLPNDADYS